MQYKILLILLPAKLSITDPSLDLSTLIHKNVTLLCEKALVMESFFEQALSLFDENTDISVIPDGFSLLPDNMELNEFTLAQLGKKLTEPVICILQTKTWKFSLPWSH